MASPRTRFDGWLPWVALALLLSAHCVTATLTPYNPTRMLRNNESLYVFQPSPHSPTQFQLNSIDISSPVEAANPAYTTLYDTLPFLDDDAPRAFTPVMDSGGNLVVYTGDCALGAGGAQLWTLTPGIPSEDGNGNWNRKDVSIMDSSHESAMGANYLSGGLSFSSVVGGNRSNTGVYFFGGMCPDTAATTTDWQSAANYSNLMVTLQPSASGAANELLGYDIDISSSRGPPVPEAGFTMTSLLPTFSDRSDGTQIQQQNLVLVGGHTSAAFINMSQIALFSLPEQSWTFIAVQEPRTDLSIQADVSTVDPRSGHTAVLTPDGQRIIVFGGWVGDTNTPAEPQYAILDVADGYGGIGNWQWTTPSTTGAGLPDNSGLYGHGATMLPGGVMMITGGYAIPSPSTRQRRASPAANTKVYLFNVTSNTWMTDYSPPLKDAQSKPTNSGLLSTPGQKVGLGVGVGLGLAAVCGLFAFYILYTRRLKKKRELREKQLEDLSYTVQRYNIEDYSPGFDGRGSRSDALDYLVDQNGPYYFPTGAQGGQGWKASNRGDVERTGLLVEIPSPTRGLRRSLSTRPGYAMGRSRGPGGIHPIDELEEEPDEDPIHDPARLSKQPEMAESGPSQRVSILDNAPVLDPFTDSYARHGEQRAAFHPVPTSPALQTSVHTQNNALGRLSPSPTGRLSPEKSTSERTSSNLSDRSTESWASSHGGVLRKASMRSATVLNQPNPFDSPDASPTYDRARAARESERSSPVDPRTRSLTSIRSNGYADDDTFCPAPSSFAHLQAEGEALLGGNPERPRPGTGSSNSNTHREGDRSDSRAAVTTPATSVTMDMAAMARPQVKERRMSWLGSMRKVLTRSASSAERTRSLTTTTSYHEPYRDNPISPIDTSVGDKRKSFPAATSPPRRAASDAGFWRNRRGKQDWLEDEQDPTWRRTAGDDWGAPEDIAMAARERQRQEWRERGTLLVNINSNDDAQLPTPRTPIGPDQLGVPISEERPCTPASEADWDVEAAVERRVVQVMFTVPKSKLRVVNADIDGSSILSVPRDGGSGGDVACDSSSSSSPGRVKDIAGRFEQLGNNNGSSSPGISPRPSPRPSPSNSIKSLKIRQKISSASLARQQSFRKASGPSSPLGKG
ncbi:hypothetical protein BDW02DRAFT_500861 [Decorospora gaudefroyi]|uniref:Galactose oxidase n=1 Tax=Decorospora gaudefroyi TaxID=184978 RepID=A0A6A5KD87_9PLEO|nr:hypothetical protein BDW02DRAFT_500861 [Decorospora gaudefroyi]